MITVKINIIAMPNADLSEQKERRRIAMKNGIKKFITMFLVFAMVIAVAAPGEISAATKADKTLTLYVGESYEGELPGYNVISSVKSSNSNILTAAKNSKDKYEYKLKAKKAGTANVTVKYKKSGKTKTYTLKVTVKKLDFKTTLTDEGWRMMLSIKNNTKQTFEYVKFEYTLKDASGKVVKKSWDYAENVVAGKTVYTTFVYNFQEYTPDVTKCSVKVTSVDRTVDYKYTDASSSVKTTVKKQVNESEGKIDFTIKTQNTLKKSVVGWVFISVYDESGNLIDVSINNIALGAKKKGSATDSTRYLVGYDLSKVTCKVSTVAYYTTN